MSPRFEGSRTRDYVIEDLANRHRADGWCAHRPRNRPVPIYVLRNDGLWVVRFPGAPHQQESFPDYHGTVDVTVGWSGGLPERHAAYADALKTFRDPEGGREFPLWSVGAKGNVGIPRPALILHRGGEVIIAEATTDRADTIHRQAAAYGAFDEILIATFPGGGVFNPMRPPEVRLHRRRPQRHPLIAVGTGGT